MSFEALPRELQLIIVSEHLRLPPWKPNPYAWSKPKPPIEPPTFDLKLALDLAIVSPSCRDIVSGILLRRVRITRPSSLRSLFTTLSQRPDLAAHIRSIHLGPDKEPEYSFYRWPIAAAGYGWPYLSLRSTLDETKEGSRVPPWYKHGCLWRDHDHVGSCTGVAVGNAIQAAINGLELEPWRKGYSKSGLHIGIRAWTSRVFLLVAALDLYILRMRQIEDARNYDHSHRERYGRLPNDCWKKVGANTCGHVYPRLQLLLPASRLATGLSHSNDGNEVFTVTEPQLWEQLDRNSGPANDFDHYTYYIMSTRLGLDMTEEEWNRVRDDLHGPGPAQVYTDVHWRQFMGYDPYEDTDRVYDPLEKLNSGRCRYQEASEEEKEAGRHRAPSPSSVDFDWRHEGQAGKRRTDRAEDLLAMARHIVSLAPQISNVSVTSLLFRSLSALPAHTIQSLTIGPRARYWDTVLPCDLTPLTNLVKLRIVGMMSQDDATKVAHQLPLLKHVEWEVTDEKGPETYTSGPSPFIALNVQSVYDVVDILQAQRQRGATTIEGHSTILGKHARQSSNCSEGDCSTDRKTPPFSPSAEEAVPSANRTTLILLRPDVASLVRDMAVNADVRQAWREGKKVPGTLHAVKIEVSRAVEPTLYKGRRNDYRDEMKVLYEAGRKWWKEGHTGPPAVEGGGVDFEESDPEEDDGEF